MYLYVHAQINIIKENKIFQVKDSNKLKYYTTFLKSGLFFKSKTNSTKRI